MGVSLVWLVSMVGAFVGTVSGAAWWESAVVYQIYPRSFKDSNNDGVGDLNGITLKLPYLKDLGVDAIWMSPIFKSPMKDFGYDITDYRAIDEVFGTMQDFDELMSHAKRLGIRVILDYVPNHTSTASEWFIKSIQNNDTYADYYIWANGTTDTKNNRMPPNNWISVFRKSAWEYNEERKQYYLHQFLIGQPDLNYRHPQVHEEMKDVLRFWLEKGVSGFRVDAVNMLFEVDPADYGGKYPDEPLSNEPGYGPDDYEYLSHNCTKDQNETYDVVYDWRAVLDEYEAKDESKLMMTEAYTDIEHIMRYYGNATRNGSIPFNFVFLGELNANSTAVEMKATISKWMQAMPAGKVANWVNGNHDQSRMATRYGDNRVDAMNMLALLLPGVTITYQGEELGMTDGEISWEETVDPQACNTDPFHYQEKSRDPSRTPFHWDSSKNAGFSNANKTWLPVASNYATVNVAVEQAAKRSHYNFYKDVVALKHTSAVSTGKLNTTALSNSVLVVTRSLSNTAVVGVINLANSTQNVDLGPISVVPKKLKVVASGVACTLEKAFELEKSNLTMPGHCVLVVEGLFTIYLVKKMGMSLGWFVFMVGAALVGSLSGAPWWESAVVYQIYPRSYKDSDNDGVGDLNGITLKLPYLKDLGVDAIWMSPIFKSPMKDFGYDITDYRAIDEIFGSMEDFDELMTHAKRLGIRVILDYVPNHTSTSSEWFIKSIQNNNTYADYYIWANGITDANNDQCSMPPNNWISIFRKSAWEYNDERKQYYLHQFAIVQPDLNYRHPQVQEEMKDVLRFWLEKGVSGFRVDAVNMLFEVDPADYGGKYPDEPLSNKPGYGPDDYEYLIHNCTKDQNETYDVVYDWRAVLDEYEAKDESKLIMTEAYTDIEHIMRYYGNATRNGSIPFNFVFLGELDSNSTAVEIQATINKWMQAMPPGKVANWVNGNHDQSRLATRYGDNRVDAMNMLALLLPGVTITYQGEELGMTDGKISWEETVDPQACNTDPLHYQEKSRDPFRTPFHWDSSKNAGFSNANKTWLPVASNYATVNVAVEQAAKRSHYNFYKDVVALKHTSAVSIGELNTMALSDNVLVVTRSLSNTAVVGVINLANSTQNVDLGPISVVPKKLKVVASGVACTLEKAFELEKSNLTMPGHCVLVVEGLNWESESASNLTCKI